MEIQEIIKRRTELESVKRELELELSQTDVQIQQANDAIMEFFRESGQNSISGQDYTFYLRADTYPRIVDRDKLLIWAHEYGHTQLISVGSQVLRGWCTENCIKNPDGSLQIPDELVGTIDLTPSYKLVAKKR